MNLAVQKLDLLWDNDLPRDSMAGDMHRQIFGQAKPLIDYAFKVDRAAFVRVWWFDRHISRVVDSNQIGGRMRRGAFYTVDNLISDTDRMVADYLVELGWQVRLSVKSIDRQEFCVLVVFSAQGALMQDNEFYHLKTLTEQELPPLDDWFPPAWPGVERLPEYAGI